MKEKKEELKDYGSKGRRGQKKGRRRKERRNLKIKKKEIIKGRKRDVASFVYGCENSFLNFQNYALT
jgi:hypothetical protein